MLFSLHGGCFLSNHKRRTKRLEYTQWVGAWGEGWLGWARKGRNKISAEKLFVLLSRLEMKRLLHRVTPISEKHSPISLQFRYFLNGKKHSPIIFTRASFQFNENKKEMRTQREFGKVVDIKDLS